MAYSDFTLDSVKRVLGVSARSRELFPGLLPIEPPTWLTDALVRGSQGMQLSLLSEKSRSEFIVAPVLMAARELSGNRVSIYSGQQLNVDSALGLSGECDFILSAAEPSWPLQSPIVTVVEAKKNDIEGGLAQCFAQMVAARRFNAMAERADHPIFGCVTTGEIWQFLRLVDSEIWQDSRRYYIDTLGLILAVIQAVIAQADPFRATEQA